MLFIYVCLPQKYEIIFDKAMLLLKENIGTGANKNCSHPK
jgi:hypothetical protein